MANAREIQARMKSIKDTIENHKRNVYDFVLKASKGEKRP